MTNYRYIPFFVLLLFQCLVAQSQSYVELTDATGFEGRLTHQDTLESAASAMTEVFWEHPNVQEQFKVFSGNFYLHQSVTKDGTTPAFEQLKAIANRQAPYYLLLAKESNDEGIYQTFKVALKLPSNEVSPCLSANWEQLIEEAILKEVNSVYETVNKNPYVYYKAELAAIHTLKSTLDKLIGCCQQSAFNGEEDICTECIMEEEGMDVNLKKNGFLSFSQLIPKIEKLSDQPTFNGSYTALESDYKITLNDWDYTDELEQLLNANPGTTGRVLYFNKDNCNAFESVFGSIGTNAGSSLRSNNSDLDVQIIILDFEEKQQVYFKLKEPEKSSLALNWILKTVALERRGGLEYIGTAITLEQCFLNETNPFKVYEQSNAFPTAMDYARIALENGGTAQDRFGADRPISLEAAKEILSKASPDEVVFETVMTIINEFGLPKAIELGKSSSAVKSLFSFIKQHYTTEETEDAEKEIEAAILICLYGDKVDAIDKWKKQFVLELLRGYWCANTANPRTFNFPFIYTGSFSYSDYIPFNHDNSVEVLDGIDIIELKAAGSNTKQGIHVLNLTIEVATKLERTTGHIGSRPVTQDYDKVTLSSSDGFKLEILVAVGHGMALERKFKDTSPDIDFTEELNALNQAVTSDNREEAKKILSIASKCLYEKIGTANRIKIINWCLETWHTNPPEEVIIVRLLETVPETQVVAFIKQFEAAINITKLFDAIDSMGARKTLVKSLIELSNKNILSIGVDKIQYYFDFYEDAFKQLNYKVESSQIVIISTSEYPHHSPPISIDSEISRFSYFAPIAINFKESIQDEEVSVGLELKGVPGLLAAYYIQKDNEEDIADALNIALTITLGALGVGEVALAIQAFQAGKTALTTFRVVLAVADLLAFSTDTYCQGKESAFCKDWKQVSFYVSIGLITTSLGDLSISLLRRGQLLKKFADYPNVQKWVEENNLTEDLEHYINQLEATTLGRLDQDEELISHFQFLSNNSLANQRFNQYLNDKQIFLPNSDIEKIEFLRLLGVEKLAIPKRLGLFSRVLADAEPASNAREAIALINNALDDVEDAFSGVSKNPNANQIPNIQDGRMYGILDDKFVKEFSDGKIRAYTRKNTIIANSDGSFHIYGRDKTNKPDQIGPNQISKSGK